MHFRQSQATQNGHLWKKSCGKLLEDFSEIVWATRGIEMRDFLRGWIALGPSSKFDLEVISKVCFWNYFFAEKPLGEMIQFDSYVSNGLKNHLLNLPILLTFAEINIYTYIHTLIVLPAKISDAS